MRCAFLQHTLLSFPPCINDGDRRSSMKSLLRQKLVDLNSIFVWSQGVSVAVPRTWSLAVHVLYIPSAILCKCIQAILTFSVPYPSLFRFQVWSINLETLLTRGSVPRMRAARVNNMSGFQVVPDNDVGFTLNLLLFRFNLNSKVNLFNVLFNFYWTLWLDSDSNFKFWS